MPLILSSARVRGRVTDLGLVSKLRFTPIATTARSRSAPWFTSLVLSRRYQNTDAKNAYTGGDLLRSPSSIADIRLKSEFEENRDIREYLRKWQEVNPNDLDPVRGPNTSNENWTQRWVGNMLNDNRETRDVAGDDLRMEEDMSDFVGRSEDETGMHHYLEPGDLVAIVASDQIMRFAVYVRSISKQQQFYTERGKWRIAYPRDLDYVIKGFIPPESLSSLLPYFPDSIAEISSEMQSAIEGGVPRDAGSHIIETINDFRSQAQEIYRNNCVRFDNMYELLADETEQTQMTLEELAVKALEVEPDALNDVLLYAVHRAARQNPFLIERDQSSLFTNHYTVAPKHIAKNLETVNQWVHEHQALLVRAMTGKETPELKSHPIQKFSQKAMRLISLSRRFRSPTTMGCVGPSAQRYEPGQDGRPSVCREMTTEAYTSQDKLIINYLQSWCIPPRQMSSSAQRSAGSHIMRATGMYSTLELHAGSAALLLQEIGVFSPWENIRLLDQDLALPGHDLRPSSESSWQEVQQVCEKLDGKKLTDKMARMRKDWGDMPVYCIDSVDAEEIDDGVSLERIPGQDDIFWIRVHIANLSAFIEPNDAIMKYAASRIGTLYTPERTYPMLPKPFTHGHFSLAPGRPTITFSAKMNLKGEVLDTDVSNGIIRNVVYLTHDKLSSMFEGGNNEPLEPLTVGGKFSNKHARTGMREELSSKDKDTFNTLRQLMLGFHDQRRKNGAMDWPTTIDTAVSVSGGDEALPPTRLIHAGAGHVIGDPIIQLYPKKANPHEVEDMTKRYLVSTLMNLACWVSAKWCAERNIPVVYDGTYYHPEYTKLTNENVSEFGGEGFLKLGPPKSVSSSSPIRHVSLGLDTYVKSTSPLRRYTDLLAHQQIEAALRFEYEQGRPFEGATSDASALPFSRNDIETYISRSRWKRNRLQKADTGSKHHWACMLLFRAFYFGECKLPETFECIVNTPYSQVGIDSGDFENAYMGVITSLGVRCDLKPPPEVGKLEILSLVEAKITGVDISRTVVHMDVTKVIRPYERTGEWA
ncbi:hypothetical protein BJX99DRAFT_222974 [Aspergillus californicus]